MSDAELLLLAVAVPLLQLDADGLVRWANEAAVQSLGLLPGEPFASVWADAAAAQGLCGTAPASAELESADAAAAAFKVHSRPLAGGGWMLTLQALSVQRAAQAVAQDQSELLDLARSFGRIGVWERNVRTLKGKWDRETWQLWGLDPQQPAPAFEDALQRIVESDRRALSAQFKQSLQRAGRYSARYRLQADDGTLRRIHSQWLVKNGSDGRPERVLGLLMNDSEAYALAQSTSELESQLALAVELGDIALWRHDLSTERLHCSLQGWRSLSMEPRPEGLSLDEVSALIHPDDLPRVLASATAALNSSHPVDVEARYRRADGSWRHQMLRRMVLRDAAGKPKAFLGVALDITERMEERRRAEAMTRRLETVTRVAGIGHWMVEAGAETAQWSLPLRTLFGIGADAPVPSMREWLQRFVHREDQGLVRQTLARWVQSGGAGVELSFRALRGDGTPLQILTHSQLEVGPDGPLLFGVVIDITERRRSEQALEHAQKRVALAAQGAGLGTWELDLVSGEAHWDAAMWRMRGLAPRATALSAEQRLACVHPEDRERVDKQMQKPQASGRTAEREFRVLWPDGQVRWIASRSTEFLDASTGHRRRIGVNWDVTDRRSAETARQEREVALRENAAKSKFLARISHELRTPLNAVLGFAQLLQADEAGSDAAATLRRRRLGHLHAAGQHLLLLINDLLDLSGLAGGESRITLQPVALRTVIEQTLAMLEPQQQKAQVHFDLGALDVHVMADATRLRQVLLNLLSNALKYNRAGGRVQIDALRHEGTVLVRITDTGRGMSAQQLGQLFEPFNRLGVDSEAIEGAGIGLAIAKALVQAMGGTIEVESRVGKGSVFGLRLAAAPAPAALADTVPATAPPAPSLPAGPAARPSAQARTHRVLYLEDNPVNALIVGELMARRSDFELHLAADGASGIAQAQALLPDLILLDMQLPDVDGYEVLRQLRALPLTAPIPCIAVSANAMPEDIERARSAGVDDYWTKPLDFKLFMASLDKLFGKAH